MPAGTAQQTYSRKSKNGKEAAPERINGTQDDEAKSEGHDEKDLNDLLQELRILLQGVQVLTAFLVILPFNQGFERVQEVEKWVYIATFICSVTGLVLFSAPAAQHRLARPLMDRVRFKEFATRMTIVGLVPSSLALVLATQLVVSEVLGNVESIVVAAIVALLIGLFWWVLPLAHKQQEQK
ncbi:MAG: DUF6328 family protein [Chloroflexota bacterium]|nr:DUF6328 family protein [Chloroflexota bacterium]